MKKYIYYITIFFATIYFTSSCDSISDAEKAKNIELLSVNLNATSSLSTVSSLNGLKVKFDNYTDDIHYTKTLSGNSMLVDGIIPGIYSITISGEVTDNNGEDYYMNGGVINTALYPNQNSISVSVGGLKISPLIFKEIYYAGVASFYFHDQYYEIYNNSNSTMYLDGLYMGDIYPTAASSSSIPIWGDGSANDYIRLIRVWKFPGTGSDYPLKPGESCVIAQYAINHKTVNPASPVDLSSSDFEFFMNNTTYPDQPADNMVHVFYQGKAAIGSIKFYLTSVMGGAYALFQIPKGVTWDPVNDTNFQSKDLSKGSSTLYAKVPVGYVLDAVEAGQDETMIPYKRVPQVLDAGMTYVGSSYCGLGVTRKRMTDDNGNVMTHPDGSIIYQDTNNSTNDFDRGVIPSLRRYGAKMPSWNHTLK